MWRRMLVMTLLACSLTPCWAQNPFSGEQVELGGSSGTQVAIPTFEQNNDFGPEPAAPADPLSSATPEARKAHDTADNILDQLETYLKNRDYKKSSEAIAYINKLSRDTKTGKTLTPGLFTSMTRGGVGVSRINELKGRLASLKNQLYAECSAKMVEAGRQFEGYNSSSGPGGGNVACAWLMTKVLRAAGMVPPGWEELGALNLTRRMMKEFGWAKVPSTGNPDSGKMKTALMQPGDIIFWSPSDHVGVYLGNGMCMSNSSSKHRGAIHPVAGFYDGWIPRYVVRPPGA
ncbi:MAG TPA: NlpC/P60 family protein [Candidatus Ozemobacteraceae bacterium]|nr:NlpC/P60 family protein [Candidatus Ozemobacteraceae bacterium]